MTFADAYQEFLVPVLFEPLAGALLHSARPAPGQRVLDVACGTGAVARRAATVTTDVTGVDAEPAMLAVARRIDPAIGWTHADAASLPFPDAAFDVVYCQQGLQFMPDPAAALGQMARVLAPGGRLALALWRDVSFSPGFRALADALDRHAGPAVGNIMRRPFGRGDAGDVSALIMGAGFGRPDVTVRTISVRFPSPDAFFQRQVAASPLAQPVAALTATTRQAIVADLADALGDTVDFPAETHIFTAQLPGPGRGGRSDT
jgi:SAM-dependent methyltransferase